MTNLQEVIEFRVDNSTEIPPILLAGSYLWGEKIYKNPETYKIK
jgi:hypothetical protein